MEAELIENEVNRIRNLKQYKSLSEEELQKIAKININLKEFSSEPLFNIETDDGKKEQKLAEKKFVSYLQKCELESSSELDTLRSLIYTEIFESRIQKELNKLATESKFPPEKLTAQLVDIQNQKIQLKIRLGIDKEEKQKDELNGFQMLIKRGDKYVQNHRDEFTWWLKYTCKKCGHKDCESYLIARPVKDFVMIKHPYFAGRWLFNYEILKDVKEGILSKENAWRYLLCAGEGLDYEIPDSMKKYCTDYINYVLDHWNEIVSFLSLKNK